MKRKIVFAILVCMGVWSCASKDFREPEVHEGKETAISQTFLQNYTNMWAAVMAALQEKKYVVAETKRDRGTIVTDWSIGKSDRLFSGYGDIKIPYNIRYKFTIIMRPKGNEVKISVKNDEQYYSDTITAGTDFNGTLYQWIATESSGKKETSLLQEVSQQLALLYPSKEAQSQP